ncbi:MAG TPA: sodium:proton antiporter [Beijerinckiaceae bacterium]|nr:sodium:proton antiporter [Beijerinckiaceae bacterium]
MNRIYLLAAAVCIPGGPALAAGGLDGRALGIAWALPFFGLLACIALGPLFFARTWHHHYGKIAAVWALVTLLPLAALHGVGPAVEVLLHALLVEYVPFIILLFALYTVAGGILISGTITGTPGTNTAILAFGTGLASVVGTTGASMILIRPLIRANDQRRHNVHVVIFFIFLVSNIGGALTPLGDPPLFVGFLRGVDFFWTTRHLLAPMLLLSVLLLAGFYLLDRWFWQRDAGLPPLKDFTPERSVKLFGKRNIPLLAAIIAVLLLTSAWKPGITVPVPGAPMPLQGLVRDILLLVIAGLSLRLTPGPVRAGNEFSWEPIAEVGKLFAAIFVCVAPVIAMLQVGKEGVFAPLVAFVTSSGGQPIPQAYFWLTGLLSAFLDNAPTYLVFFELAGGNAADLMTAKGQTLLAISCGAVFMGALTYIGNAPNLMVATIARDMKIQMPGFLGFMAWSFGILVPLFLLVGWLFI